MDSHPRQVAAVSSVASSRLHIPASAGCDPPRRRGSTLPPAESAAALSRLEPAAPQAAFELPSWPSAAASTRRLPQPPCASGPPRVEPPRRASSLALLWFRDTSLTRPYVRAASKPPARRPASAGFRAPALAASRARPPTALPPLTWPLASLFRTTVAPLSPWPLPLDPAGCAASSPRAPSARPVSAG